MNRIEQQQIDLQAMINAEKARETFIRRVTFAAWGVTLATVLTYAAITAAQVMRVMRRVSVGAESPDAIAQAVLPLVATIGGVALLVAVVSTLAIFLRLRSASLSDIQLRLASLEGMIVASADRSTR